MTHDLPDDDDLFAAELAFGLLDAPEREAAERRLDSDPAFADAYRRWLDWSVAMFTGAGEAPRPSIWTKIEARLPANDAARVHAADPALPWWRGGAIAASALAASLALVLVTRPVPAPVIIAQAPPARPPLAAILTGPDSRAVVTISFDPVTGRLLAAPSGLQLPGHSAELWIIAPGAKPRSLGIIDAGTIRSTRAPADAGKAIAADATFAISSEPLGGSRTGAPTGPVVASGKIVAT
jgi:anti-sigma-K factor RskA